MKYSIKLGMAAFSALILISCGSDNKKVQNDDNNAAYQTVELSTGTVSKPTWAYYNFDEGKQVKETDAWQIAFRRREVKVHDGVRSAIGDKKEHFYHQGKPVEEAFVNIDEAVERQAFYNVTTVKNEDFVNPGTKSAINNSWYDYQHASQEHRLTANVDNYWYIKSATGHSFAKMHASSISDQYVATFAFYIQAAGEASYRKTPVSIDVPLLARNTTCFDIDKATPVACDTEAWDVQFDIAPETHRYQIKLNGGVSGNGKAAAYGPVGGDKYTSGTAEDLRHAYITDVEGNAFSYYSPWAYGVQGPSDHTVWPNYRTYIIDLGENKGLIKLQLTGYYGANQTSGSGTIDMRYMDLSDKGE